MMHTLQYLLLWLIITCLCTFYGTVVHFMTLVPVILLRTSTHGQGCILIFAENCQLVIWHLELETSALSFTWQFIMAHCACCIEQNFLQVYFLQVFFKSILNILPHI